MDAKIKGWQRKVAKIQANMLNKPSKNSGRIYSLNLSEFVNDTDAIATTATTFQDKDGGKPGERNLIISLSVFHEPKFHGILPMEVQSQRLPMDIKRHHSLN